MNDEQVLAYVQAAAAALGIPLDDARAARVAMHLGRTAALAGQLDAFPLEVSDEPAEIYSPLAFPPTPDVREHL